MPDCCLHHHYSQNHLTQLEPIRNVPINFCIFFSNALHFHNEPLTSQCTWRWHIGGASLYMTFFIEVSKDKANTRNASCPSGKGSPFFEAIVSHSSKAVHALRTPSEFLMDSERKTRNMVKTRFSWPNTHSRPRKIALKILRASCPICLEP